MLKKSYILNFIIDAKFNILYKTKYLLFLSWDWEAWCLTVWGVIPRPPERNTTWNKGRKCFHCLGAPNNLIRPWLFQHLHIKLNSNFLGKTLPKRFTAIRLYKAKVCVTGRWNICNGRTGQAILCINGSNCKVMINWVPLSGEHRPITVFEEEAWKINCMSE